MRSDRLRSMLFTVFVAFTLATQARMPVLNVGLGEVAGLALLALEAPRLVAQARRRASVLWPMAMVVAGFMTGWMYNLIFGVSHFTEARDMFALVYAMLAALAAISHLERQDQPLISAAMALSAALWVQLVPLMLSILGMDGNWWLGEDDEPGIAFLSRYMGFSTNPNQLGVLVCAFPFVAMQALSLQTTRNQLVQLALGLLACTVISVLIVSNTVFATYIVAGTLAAVLTWNRFGTGAGLRPARAVASTGLILLAAVGLAYYVDASIEKTGDRDANGRFQRWTTAAQGIVDTVFLGAGPGGQSGEVRPFDGTEAHNTLLDLTLQGGALALAGYLILVFTLFRRAASSGSVLIVCVLIAALIQQFTHYTMRHPLNWIYMLLPLVAAAANQRGARLPES